MLLLLQVCSVLAICLSYLYKWMGRKEAEQRGNEESCGLFPAVHSQRICLAAKNWSILLSEWGGKVPWYCKSLTWKEIQHIPTVPSPFVIAVSHTISAIYSHAATGNYLITHDWNELSLFKFRNTQISPPAFRLAWILVWCVTLQTRLHINSP